MRISLSDMNISAAAGIRLFGVLALAALFAGDVGAQQQQYSRCWLLEQELAAYDRGGIGDNPDIEKYSAAIEKQEAALARTEEHAGRIGCFKRGFLFFRPDRPAECPKLEASIEKMRRNLAELTARRDSLIGPSPADDPGRRRILRLLAENNCGGQYQREAGFSRPRGLFNNLFEEDAGPSEGYRGFGERMLGDVPTYRTLCVRTCDGYYFPISFATLPQRFEQDAAQCRAMCPTAVVELYVHQNPGGAVDEMISLAGKPYTSIPTAFKYRKEYVRGCSCNPYTLALEEAEDRLKNGDKPKVVGPEALNAQPQGEENAGGGEPGQDGGQASEASAQDGGTAGFGSPQDAGNVNVFRPGGEQSYPEPRFTTRDLGNQPEGPNIIRIGPRDRADVQQPQPARSKEELPPYLDPLRTR